MNPFQSPTSAAADDPPPRTPLPGRLVHSGRLSRSVELPPPYGVAVSYRMNFLANQTVQVNGRVVARRWSIATFGSCFDFWLDVATPVGFDRRPAKLWVELGGLLNIRRLTIVVDDRVVYDEP